MNAGQANEKENFSLPFGLSGVPEVYEFVGRKKELFEIKQEFQRDGLQRKVVVLRGLGGIGKTQLALAFIKEQRDTYSAAFWLNGRSEDTLRQSFSGMANRLYNEYPSECPSSALLKIAAEEKDIDQTITVIRRWLSIRGNTRWILVFDNIDNPKLDGNGMKDPQGYDIRSYFPEADQGHILITTRSSRLEIGKVISIKKLLNIQESIAIMASMSRRRIPEQGIIHIEINRNSL